MQKPAQGHLLGPAFLMFNPDISNPSGDIVATPIRKTSVINRTLVD
jgi:hypothetical protein